jgi:hypothetical protein
MKHVLLFCGSDEDAAAFQAMTPDELRARCGPALPPQSATTTLARSRQ